MIKMVTNSETESWNDNLVMVMMMMIVREKLNYSVYGICFGDGYCAHVYTAHAECQLLLSCGRSSPHCCRWWWAWTSTPLGTTACARSQPCWRWRWCRWSWCNHRRSSGLCCAHRCLKPRRKWSLGPSSPEKKGRKEVQVSATHCFNRCRPDLRG